MTHDVEKPAEIIIGEVLDVNLPFPSLFFNNTHLRGKVIS